MPDLSDAPRRSSRRPKPKNFSSYSVGDVVQITRHNVEARGRLAYKLSEGATPNPRWLVKFEGPALKDEELYERSFGKILEKSDETDSVSKGSGSRKSGKNKGTGSKKSSPNKNSGSSSGEESSSKKKSVALSENSVAASEDSTSSRNAVNSDEQARITAREQRSRRRQAKVHEEVTETGYNAGDKRGRFGSPLGRGGSVDGNFSNKKGRKEEEVLKIPMLTGTLYLYRGANARAEFIRRV